MTQSPISVTPHRRRIFASEGAHILRPAIDHFIIRAETFDADLLDHFGTFAGNRSEPEQDHETKLVRTSFIPGILKFGAVMSAIDEILDVARLPLTWALAGVANVSIQSAEVY